MIVFLKGIRVECFFPRKVLTEGNMKNLRIQGEVRPKVHYEKQKSKRL